MQDNEFSTNGEHIPDLALGSQVISKDQRDHLLDLALQTLKIAREKASWGLPINWKTVDSVIEKIEGKK